jgi:hypothetical protein
MELNDLFYKVELEEIRIPHSIEGNLVWFETIFKQVYVKRNWWRWVSGEVENRTPIRLALKADQYRVARQYIKERKLDVFIQNNASRQVPGKKSIPMSVNFIQMYDLEGDFTFWFDDYDQALLFKLSRV